LNRSPLAGFELIGDNAIDLFYQHRVDPEVPIEEVLRSGLRRSDIPPRVGGDLTRGGKGPKDTKPLSRKLAHRTGRKSVNPTTRTEIRRTVFHASPSDRWAQVLSNKGLARNLFN